jgi:hypothetical protein
VACGCLSTATANAADTLLRWKFKEGDSMNYVMQRASEAKIDLSGSQIEFNSGMTFDTSWKIKSVDSDGSAVVEQTLDRIQLKMDSPLGGGLNYDSKVPGSGEGQVWEMMGPMFEAMVGQTFSMKVSPIGKVTDIKIPEKIAAQLAKAAANPGRRNPLGAMGGMGLSEASIKEMLERSFVLLPEKAVAADVTWKQNFEEAMKGAGVKKTEITYSTTESETADGHKVQKIAAKTELTFEPEENPMADIEIDDQEGTATIAFDVDAGRTVKLDGKQKQTMVIASPNREISVEQNEKTTVRQGKSPDPKPADAKDEKKDEKK